MFKEESKLQNTFINSIVNIIFDKKVKEIQSYF